MRLVTVAFGATISFNGGSCSIRPLVILRLKLDSYFIGNIRRVGQMDQKFRCLTCVTYPSAGRCCQCQLDRSVSDIRRRRFSLLKLHAVQVNMNGLLFRQLRANGNEEGAHLRPERERVRCPRGR